MRSSSCRFLQLWVLVLVMVNVVAICKGQDYTFNITESDYSMFCTDNVNSMLVNSSIPGPALNLTYGQTVTVNVINNAKHGLTIHWHGVKQPRNPWSDGPEYVTQCPIQPGSNFTYEIMLSDEEGTLWWHAHSEWSRATVYGPIFINPGPDRTRPYEIDGEQEIIFGTWFEKDVMEYVKDHRENGAGFPGPTGFRALTINGKPGDTYNDEDGCTPDMFEMEVESNKVYLLRIINAAMNEALVFGVANHTLTVVGTDAAYIEPVKTDQIMIHSGQTMDVLLTTDQSPDHNYYMSAKFGTTAATTGLVKYPNGGTTAGIPVELDDQVDVATFTAQFRSLNNTRYNYSDNVPQGTADTNIFMTVTLNQQLFCFANQTCHNMTSASLSNVTFVPPEVDVLQAYALNMSGVYETDFPTTEPGYNYTGDNATGFGTYAEVNGTRVFEVEYNSTVEMVFQGVNVYLAGAHPIHVHGYSFYSVASGSGNFNRSNVTYNLVDPPLINTASLPSLGWTAIRFRADNPGVWFIHCHLERHSFTGMDAVMIVKNGPSNDTSMLPPPYTLNGNCSASN